MDFVEEAKTVIKKKKFKHGEELISYFMKKKDGTTNLREIFDINSHEFLVFPLEKRL